MNYTLHLKLTYMKTLAKHANIGVLYHLTYIYFYALFIHIYFPVAPEILMCSVDHSNGYSFQADWWSLGITAYEMLCRGVKHVCILHFFINFYQVYENVR